jgi:SAM-dependent methyltransferase
MLPMCASFVGPPPGQAESLDRMADADNYNEWLLARAKPFIGERVLDFGSGIGTFAAAIQPPARVVAVEPDPAFAESLRERFADAPHVNVVEGDANWLSAEDRHGAFDTIICFNVLEHIRDDEGVLRAFHDCLATAGHVLLVVPAHQWLFGEIDRSVGHERRYSRTAVRHLMSRVGLDVVECRYVNPVGALGWLVSSRLSKQDQVPSGPLRAYDRAVPLLRRLDVLPWPFGLSVWAVARRPG